ncbi:MAG: hypothetical protein K2L63_06560 [Paramuribaculum sp.]|nr:hypothetical protein [Paramuribaculum sp.]
MVAVEGDARLVDAEGRVTILAKGYAALIPATMPEVTVEGDCKIVTTFIR